MASNGQLVDWRTWVYLREHQTPELLESMALPGRSPRVDESVPEVHRSLMEGVEKYLILGLQWPHAGYDVPNDFISEVVADSGGHAVGLACVNPDDPRAPAEFERCVNHLGLRGLSLTPFGQGFDPWSTGAWKLYEMCQDLGLPIVFNQGIVGYRFTVLDHSHPLLVDKIARSFPNLKINMGHLGHPWIDETISLLRKHPTIVADLALLYDMKWRFYHTMRLAMDYRVTDRLVFGSDCPFQAPHVAIESFRNINNWAVENGLPPIPEEVIEGIIYHRPLSLIGL